MRKFLANIKPTSARDVFMQFLLICVVIVTWHLVWTLHILGRHDRGIVELVVDALVVGGPFVAFYSVISWHQIRSLEYLYTSARIDPLSGVLNRQTFFRRANKAVASSNCGMLILMDADFFKQINDEHGHATGDECIRAIGQRLTWHLREVDVAGRVGGEEFAVFLPGVAKQHGRVVAERLAQPISFVDPVRDKYLSITMSVGAVWTVPDHSAEAQLMMADDALYQAKTSGRARMIIVGEDEPIMLGRSSRGGDRRRQSDQRRTTSRPNVA